MPVYPSSQSSMVADGLNVLIPVVDSSMLIVYFLPDSNTRSSLLSSYTLPSKLNNIFISFRFCPGTTIALAVAVLPLFVTTGVIAPSVSPKATAPSAKFMVPFTFVFSILEVKPFKLLMPSPRVISKINWASLCLNVRLTVVLPLSAPLALLEYSTSIADGLL